jgi:hypothetical protein
MSKANLNTRSKRTRELARKDKRAAKDEKRAQKKADARAARAAVDGTPPPPRSAAPNVAAVTNVRSLAAAAFIRRMNKTP